MHIHRTVWPSLMNESNLTVEKEKKDQKVSNAPLTSISIVLHLNSEALVKGLHTHETIHLKVVGISNEIFHSM